MKYLSVVAVLAGFLASCSGAEKAQPPPQPLPQEEPNGDGRSAVVESRLVSTVATVEAVNPENRTITLKGPRGENFSFTVDKQVKNLSRVEVGDRVTVDYYQSVAMELVKPSRSVTEKDVVLQTSEPGDKPTELAVRRTTVVATVEKIDRMTPSITLRGPEGNVVTAVVRKPERLNMVKVGDQLRITYSEAVAVAVEPAPDTAK